ncbi:hypothetical protein [Paraburkholderia saeva]|uniref:hypothetical protein n=1 Tax=Paraburkholderia saeva TaxID=2777537 RepID=UPI001D2EB7E5|nr:hypothetical protein [Paraburkholderia saeva]CAG4906473.1 hypothetical protein R70241_03423 [Paraburkholderia saeva]
MTRRAALVLAVAATSTSICMSLLAGWQRGGWLSERLVWIALGVVLVTAAHLLPALLRDAPTMVRVTGSVSWCACLMTACIGHAVFFVTAQQHAGELRVLAVPTAPVQTSGRSLTSVMAERAVATAQLATVNARYCTGICARLEARRTSLAARVDALNAEADDIRRQQVAAARVTTRRDALRADPVTSRFAALLGVPASRIDLLFGSLFAAVLEGVACLLWAVALRPSSLPVATGARMLEVAAVTGSVDTTPPTITAVANAPHPAVKRVTVSHPEGAPGHETLEASPPSSASDPVDNHLTQLVSDIADGRVRPTVADIRRHLGCSQAKAVALRRQLGPLKS